MSAFIVSVNSDREDFLVWMSLVTEHLLLSDADD